MHAKKKNLAKALGISNCVQKNPRYIKENQNKNRRKPKTKTLASIEDVLTRVINRKRLSGRNKEKKRF